ncbi:MAG: SGNH/GDSL hydrolase family protein [Pirellulales bacterium]
MFLRSLFCISCSLLFLLGLSWTAQGQENKIPRVWENEQFQLVDGDRVVFLGNTFLEREQRYGYIETQLTLAYSDKKVLFRNLGWSGDNVRGESRARFGNTAEGYAHLQRSLELVKPTVVFVSYGSNAGYQGKAGLAEFEAGYNTLLDSIDKYTTRIVMLSPTPLEKLAAPLPDPAEQNARLAIYRDAIKDMAYKRGYLFVDLFDQLGTNLQRHQDKKVNLTDDTMHLTAYGYWEASFPFAKLSGKDNAVAIRSPMNAKQNEAVEKLRQTILKKNELFFYRYRPQNETYLYLFRKHEQGNNAAEIPLFDPLIEAQEKKIDKLKQQVVKQN